MTARQIATIKPTDLPSPPQTAIEILQACARPDVGSQELSKIAGRDPVLTAEILRMANSAYFGLAREVRTVARAVTVLGQRALRNLVLCVTMRKALQSKKIPGFDPGLFWEDCLRRAVAARALGATRELMADECFTIGLLQDFGFLVMLHTMPKQAENWRHLRASPPDHRYVRERETFGVTHDQVNQLLAETWSLPDEIGIPMAYHHVQPPADTTPEIQALCRIAEAADWMAAVYTTENSAAGMRQCQDRLREWFELGDESIDALLRDISTGVEEAAAALGLRVEKQQPLDELLRAAQEKLAEEALTYQELNWKLERTLRERDRLASELNKELDLAREIQQSLLPKQPDAHARIAGLNISARAVSGDFYDYFTIEDGRIFFNLADVSGKGMNAALLMAKTSSLFHCLGKTVHDLKALVRMINAELCESSTRGVFVTLVAGLLDPKTSEVELINAGHLPAVWVQDAGNTKTFPAQSPPLGVLPTLEFDTVHFKLDRGTLFLFSDGLSEGRINGRDALGIEGVTRLLARLPEGPVQARLQQLVQIVSPPGHVLEDDLTVLAVDGRR